MNHARLATLGLGTLASAWAASPPALALQHVAQVTIEPEYLDYGLNLDPPEGQFGRSEYGDFDGDGQEDVALLAGTRLDVLFAPGIHEALVIDVSNPWGLNLNVTDFSVLRNNVGPDFLVFADELGISWLEFNTGTSPYGITRHLVSSQSGLGRLDAWSDGAGNFWIGAVSADGVTLYSVQSTTDGPLPNSWSSMTSHATGSPSPPIDFVLFDETDAADNAPSMAMLIPLGLGVFDPWGDTLISNFTIVPGITYTDMTRISRGSTGNADSLGFLAEMNGNDFYITMHDGVTQGLEWLPNAEDFYSLTAGRGDEDDLDDIVLAGHGSEKLFLMYDQADDADDPPSYSFDSQKFEEYPAEAGDALLQFADPLFVDVDHDNDGDLTIALQDNLELRVLRSGVIDSARYRADFLEAGFGTVTIEEPGPGNQGEPGNPAPSTKLGAHVRADTSSGTEAEWWIDVKVTLPDPLPSDYFEVIAWRCDSGSFKINTSPIHSERLDATGWAGTTQTVSISPDEAGEAFNGDVWEDQIYVIFQFVDAPSSSAPQTKCYAAQGILIAPSEEGYLPPHTGTGNEFALMVDQIENIDGSFHREDPLPEGKGDSTGCVPANNPPMRN